jgi:hypothetical protein
MCSDGLIDLYSRHSTAGISTAFQRWLTRTSVSGYFSDNLALDILVDALDGTEKANKMLSGESLSGRRVDDTTVIVVQL